MECNRNNGETVSVFCGYAYRVVNLLFFAIYLSAYVLKCATFAIWCPEKAQGLFIFAVKNNQSYKIKSYFFINI